MNTYSPCGFLLLVCASLILVSECVDKKPSCSDPALSGLKDAVKEEEIKAMVETINKMRCVLGAPPLKWDKDLACEAQHDEDTAPTTHTPGLPSLKGWGTGLMGECLAMGSIPDGPKKMEMAAFMWFGEYMNQCKGDLGMQCPDTGHYSTIAWRSLTSIGCGIKRGTAGSIRCQFHVGEDNKLSGDMKKMFFMPAEFATMAPHFEGTKKQFANPKCKFPLCDLKKWTAEFKKWGIAHPKAEFASAISLDDTASCPKGDDDKAASSAGDDDKAASSGKASDASDDAKGASKAGSFGKTKKNCECREACGKHGESYTWCHTSDSCGSQPAKSAWDYCKVSRLFDENSIESNIISGDQHFSTVGVATLAVAGVALLALGVVVGRKTRGSYVAPENSDEELLQNS